MTTPLNPYLYTMLSHMFGGPPVITNQGEPFSYDVVSTPRGYRMKARGEQYSVSCPDCSDKKKRLYFNHMYGARISDPRFPGPLIDLCYCQHEQRPKPKWYALLGKSLSDPMVALTVQQQTACATPKGNEPVTMGDVTPLRELSDSHPAVQYLRSRGYETSYLSDVYGACVSNSHPDEKIDRMVRGRIIFPFLVDGHMLTWQARLAYDLPKSQKFPPKWYFPGGSKTLWGYDVARQFPVLILCEGILSAVNFGPAGVSVGGKTLLYSMNKLVVGQWKYAVVALDPDAGINRTKDPDFQERMVRQLHDAGLHVSGVLWTPGDNRDPGDLGPVGCLELLKRSAPWCIDMLPYLGV